jgi:hypothetical protein
MKEKMKSTKDDIKDTIILYPGGFKPLTGGHIHIINKYLQQPVVKQVVLFISPGKRDEIDCDAAYKIVKKILSNYPVEIVLDKKSYSPILACYRWIQEKERTPGKYALAASSKGDDYKRVKEFSYNYTPERYAKNLPVGVEVTELILDVDPLTYINGEPISATRAREDLKTGNYERFKENFPILPEGSIEFIWNILNQSVNNKEKCPVLPG